MTQCSEVRARAGHFGSGTDTTGPKISSMIDFGIGAFLCPDGAREITEMIDRERQVGEGGFADRLAVSSASAVPTGVRTAAVVI